MRQTLTRGVAAFAHATKGMFQQMAQGAVSGAEVGRLGARADQWHDLYAKTYNRAALLLTEITKYYVEKYNNRILARGLHPDDEIAKKGLRKIKRMAFRDWRDIMYKTIQHIAHENVFKEASDIQHVDDKVGNNRVNTAISDLVGPNGKLKRVLERMQMRSTITGYNMQHKAFTANMPGSKHHNVAPPHANKPVQQHAPHVNKPVQPDAHRPQPLPAAPVQQHAPHVNKPVQSDVHRAQSLPAPQQPKITIGRSQSNAQQHQSKPAVAPNRPAAPWRKGGMAPANVEHVQRRKDQIQAAKDRRAAQQTASTGGSNHPAIPKPMNIPRAKNSVYASQGNN